MLAWKRQMNYICFWRCLYVVLKNILAISHGFIKTFCLERSRYFRLSMVYCRTYQELGQGEIYSLNQEKFPFLSICLLPTYKKM